MEEEHILLVPDLHSISHPVLVKTPDHLSHFRLSLKEKFDKLARSIQTGNYLELEAILRKLKSIEITNFQDETGKTLLHLAAENANIDCLKILLQLGADPNKTDIYARSPLHWVLDGGCHCEKCSNKIIQCIEKLLEYGADVGAEDLNQDTPLTLSARNVLPKCAVTLIDHGAMIKPGNGNTVQLIVEGMPEVFHRILDRGISNDEHDRSKLRLDFGWIFKAQKKSDASNFPPGHVMYSKHECPSRFHEMSVLLKLTKIILCSPERRAVLTHPWLEAFLHLKWMAVRKWFWLLRLFYLCFLIFYTYFIFEIYVWRCPYSSYYNTSESETVIRNEYNSSFSNSSQSNLTDSETQLTCETNLPNVLLYLCSTLGLLCLFCMVINEIFEFKLDPKAYMTNYLNLLWWNLIISYVLTMPPAFGMIPRPWQYPVAAFSLFYAWGMNFTQVSRLPFFGDYIEMLGKVLTDFSVFVLTFISLIVAFTLSMCVMFPENEFFQSVPLAFVKVLIIMIGEPDYDGLFKENERNQNLEYSIPAHLMYVAFIFIGTIVLMNLLLALAVNDIQELRKQSTIKRAIRQITQISMLEIFINNVGIATWLASHVLRTSSVEATVGRYFTFSPINPLEDRLPEELKHKFIRYLASSPCLKRNKPKLKSFLAPIRWKNFKNKGKEEHSPNNPNPPPVYPCGEPPTESEQIILMLKLLSEDMVEMKSKMEKLSIKVDRNS